METLQRKLGYKIDRGQKESLRALEDEFLQDFWKFIPKTVEKKSFNARDISRKLGEVADGQGLPVISLDRVYLPKADDYMEVTRLTDPLTGEVTIGERPGNKPLSEQFEILKKYSKIVLADVGSFEGSTLLEVCSGLEKKGIEVAGIIVGFVGKKAAANLSSKYSFSTLYQFDFYEWIELRDFFGIDGRRIPGQTGFIPYWNNLTAWASLAPEKEVEAVRLCKEYNRRLTGVLGGRETW